MGVTGETQDFQAITSILGSIVYRLERTYTDILQSLMVQIRQKTAFLYRLANLRHFFTDNFKKGCTNFPQNTGPPLNSRRQKVQQSRFHTDDPHVQRAKLQNWSPQMYAPPPHRFNISFMVVNSDFKKNGGTSHNANFKGCCKGRRKDSVRHCVLNNAPYKHMCE